MSTRGGVLDSPNNSPSLVLLPINTVCFSALHAQHARLASGLAFFLCRTNASADAARLIVPPPAPAFLTSRAFPPSIMSSSETLPLYNEHRAVQGIAEDMAPSPSTYGLIAVAFRGAPSPRRGGLSSYCPEFADIFFFFLLYNRESRR